MEIGGNFPKIRKFWFFWSMLFRWHQWQVGAENVGLTCSNMMFKIGHTDFWNFVFFSFFSPEVGIFSHFQRFWTGPARGKSKGISRKLEISFFLLKHCLRAVRFCAKVSCCVAFRQAWDLSERSALALFRLDRLFRKKWRICMSTIFRSWNLQNLEYFRKF